MLVINLTSQLSKRMVCLKKSKLIWHLDLAPRVHNNGVESNKKTLKEHLPKEKYKLLINIFNVVLICFDIGLNIELIQNPFNETLYVDDSWRLQANNIYLQEIDTSLTGVECYLLGYDSNKIQLYSHFIFIDQNLRIDFYESIDLTSICRTVVKINYV